jgi:hypothetical protein
VTRRAAAVTLAVLGALLVVAQAVGFTTAAFTSASGSQVAISAAPDWTPPTVAMTSPGSPIKGAVTISATASDADSGLAGVTLQAQQVGGSWTTLCSPTTAPWSCSWVTTGVADGQYDLRAIATDKAGYAAVSDTVRTTVANNLLVVLGDPGDVVRGSVPLSATLYNGGTTSYKVNVEYTLSGGTSWKSVTGCTGLASPYTCTWASTGFANDSYDLRAVAVAGGTTTYSATVPDVLVDNIAPTVTMSDPGSPLAGTRTFATTAADAGSGVAQVLVQAQLSGASTWTTLCTITTSPWSCAFDTTSIVDGTYAFRAVATDGAGNATTSASVTGRVVDNTVSSVSMNDPGAWVSGTTTVSAVANSTAGVRSVRIDVAPTGTTTWTALCTATTAPWSCAWNTTSLADGSYDLRAVLTDGTTKVTTSATVTTRVDNSPLRAYDVQAVNGTGTAGKLDSGDTITLTYTEAAKLSTFTTGWDGTALAVTVRLRDGNLLGLTSKGDTLDVLRSGAAVNLGSVNLNGDYVKGSKTVTWAATMAASTTTVNGVTATRVTLTLGALASGTGLRTVTTTGTMVWTPSAAVTDLTGRPVSTSPASERGTLDRDF